MNYFSPKNMENVRFINLRIIHLFNWLILKIKAKLIVLKKKKTFMGQNMK